MLTNRLNNRVCFPRVSANYRYIDLDRFDLNGTLSGFNLHLVVMLD